MGFLVFCSELSNSVFFKDNACSLSNINPITLCTHDCDVNYEACYRTQIVKNLNSVGLLKSNYSLTV